MQSRSFGNKRRISRKAGHENMSAQAESCELRTLLCASVTSAGVMDSLDLPMDGNDFEMMPAIEPEIDESVKFVLDDSVSPGTDEGPVDRPVDGSVDGPVDGSVDGPVNSDDMWLQPVGWDPSWIYQTLNIESEPMSDAASGEAAAAADGYPEGYTGPRYWQDYSSDGQFEGSNGEKLPTGEDVCLDDTAPVDAWDPSWAYRTFVTLAGGALEDSVTWGDQPSDGEKVTVDESNVFDDTPPVEGWDPSWDYPTLEVSLGDEEVPNLDASDTQPLEEVGSELLVVVKDGEPIEGEPSVVDPTESVPVSATEWSDADPFVFYSSAVAGGNGVELQRGHDSSNVPEGAVAPSTIVIPVRQSSPSQLFNSNRDRLLVGIPAAVQSNSALVENALPAKRNDSPRRLSTQVTTATQSAAVSEGLNNLKPLLGDDAEPNDNKSNERTVDPRSEESDSIEETVNAHADLLTVASGFAANRTVSSQSGRGAMIDRVMAQYAENSFSS